MPSALADHGPRTRNGIVKFTNCLLVKNDSLVKEDLWISSINGKILRGQEVFYGQRSAPAQIVDLGGKILSPGLIDVQLNGAYGFDFSVIPEEGSVAYGKGVLRVNKNLVNTGVTSYLPTLTSQRPGVYQKALPYLGPSGQSRDPRAGSESLGAHCEGPFLSPNKNGIHNVNVLQNAPNGISDLEACYGSANLTARSSPIKKITLAPELPGALDCIMSLSQYGIIASIGHSDASYEEARLGIKAGAKMVTHLFNAMKPLHHRNPGIFGLLGTVPSSPRSSIDSISDVIAPPPEKPYFGIIADGIHLHPTSIKIAWHAHPDGLILVSDAMRLAGMPDGTYEWTNGSRIIKEGALLTLEENGKIAGSSIELLDCVTNFINWTGASVPHALKAATETPAKMLGLDQCKGVLSEGADADLIVLDEVKIANGEKKLRLEQVWKFGEKVFEKEC